MLLLMDKAGCPVASRAKPWDRLLIRLRGFRLDQDLAGGASPEASVELALRAQLLVRPRHRRELARSMGRLLSTAQRSPYGGRLPVPVCRDRVRQCGDEMGELIGRLQARGPVAAHGVAKAGLLLADASGPLYRRSSGDDLRARVREAADALIPAGLAPAR
jgi:AcrR family transcriptional regulator